MSEEFKAWGFPSESFSSDGLSDSKAPSSTNKDGQEKGAEPQVKEEAKEAPRRKRSRWGGAAPTPATPATPTPPVDSTTATANANAAFLASIGLAAAIPPPVTGPMANTAGLLNSVLVNVGAANMPPGCTVTALSTALQIAAQARKPTPPDGSDSASTSESAGSTSSSDAAYTGLLIGGPNTHIPDAPEGDGQEPKKKRSRWGKDQRPDPLLLNPIVSTLAANMNSYQRDAFLLRLRIEDINRRLLNPLEDDNPATRSPSPEPVYDSKGIRTNTRIQRRRDKLLKDRAKLLQESLKYNPHLQLAGMKDILRGGKFEKILWIPQDKYPDYNFVGLIIGPRGNTQKRLERETGAKVQIRGKGAYGRKRCPEDDTQPLHVLCTADNQEALDKVVALVEKMLIPVDDDKNIQKALQLRELAEINGTVKDNVLCRLCGAKGHTVKNCTERQGASWKPADVMCMICGLASHITSDCPLRQPSEPGSVGPATAGPDGPDIQKEYANFLAELTGEGAAAGSVSSGATSLLAGPTPSSTPLSTSGPPPPSGAQGAPRPPIPPPPPPPHMAGAGFYPPYPGVPPFGYPPYPPPMPYGYPPFPPPPRPGLPPYPPPPQPQVNLCSSATTM